MIEIKTETETDIDIDTMLERDAKKIEMFQVQAINGSNDINLVRIGEYTKMPVSSVMKLPFVSLGIECELLSYLVTIYEIACGKCPMIGFVIRHNRKNVTQENHRNPTLELVYNKNDKKFEIIYTDDKNRQTIKKSFVNYIGNTESVHLLTQVLVEDVISKYQ